MREVARISLSIDQHILMDIITSIVTTFTVNASGVLMDIENDDIVFYEEFRNE